jgi:hypothetical protein
MEREAGGWRVVASAGGLSRHARADDESGVHAALARAVKDLKGALAGRI